MKSLEDAVVIHVTLIYLSLKIEIGDGRRLMIGAETRYIYVRMVLQFGNATCMYPLNYLYLFGLFLISPHPCSRHVNY